MPPDPDLELLIATRSEHKAEEAARVLRAWRGRGVRTVTLAEAGLERLPEEDGLEPFDTFAENAAAKARHYARRAGMAAVADDSGLEVEALKWGPGVRTKRFAPRGLYPGMTRDEANNEHLLELLRSLPAARRRARYVCVACLCDAAGEPIRHFRGEASGRILEEGRGRGGFGYDPLFQAEDDERSYAELSGAEKDALSHRGQAFRALARFVAGARPEGGAGLRWLISREMVDGLLWLPGARKVRCNRGLRRDNGSSLVVPP